MKTSIRCLSLLKNNDFIKRIYNYDPYLGDNSLDSIWRTGVT